MLESIKTLALKAGQAILKIYQNAESNWQIECKADNSPLTFADRESHRIISETLQQTGIPVLSEEGEKMPFEIRKNWERLWIVDPLDGTKEFIKRNDEFTVNIALVEKGVPTLGVIFAPAKGKLWWGDNKKGAFTASVTVRMDFNDNQHFIIETPKSLPIPMSKEQHPLRIVASRSHLSSETELFINQLREKYSQIQIVSAGSSLKICLVAEGHADIYPRLAPTMEWDTAAGHAIALAAGCSMTDANTGQPLRYNKEDLHNPYFIVRQKDFLLP